jgi:thiamine transport system substrate-binding protein
MRTKPIRLLAATLAAAAMLLGATACGGSSKSSSSSTTIAPGVTKGSLVRFDDPVTIKVVTHDSFAVSQSVLDEFTAATNVTVQLVPSGDAVAMTNAAILTAGNPVGDVLFGVDENLLGAAFDANLFAPYTAVRLGDVDPTYVLDSQHRVTPIDHGDVCVNFDRNSLTNSGTTVPTGFDGLATPSAKNQFVVEDPTSSTPGLAFMLATIAHFGGGDDTTSNAAWLQYWKSLKDNGVQVADSWDTAYYGDFSGGSGKGSKPFVVSYASSPPAEVTDASIPVDQSPTGVITSTCYRQTEFAGVLSGAEHPEAAAAFIEFMLGASFQADMPGQMYVYPVVNGTTLPAVFEKFTAPVPSPLSIPYEEVTANRDRWVAQWSTLFR